GIEQRLAAFRPAPAGWDSAHLAFASGMGAIGAVAPAAPRLVPRSDLALRVALWGGSFETHIVLDALPRPGLRLGRPRTPGRPRTQAELAEATRRSAYDLLVAEPVTYDYDMSVLDLDAVARAWSERVPNRTAAVIFDTTLCGDTLPHTRLLAAVASPPPAFVA